MCSEDVKCCQCHGDRGILRLGVGVGVGVGLSLAQSLQEFQLSPGGLVTAQIAGPHPLSFWIRRPRVSSRICISSLGGDAYAAGLGPPL